MMKIIINKKSHGQASLLSHTVTIGFSVLLIFVVITSMNSIKQDYQEFIGNEEILQVCSMIKSAIERIYWPSSYQLQSNSTLGEVTIDLPERIADLNYRAEFQETSIFIETLRTPKLNQTCKIGFNATYTGSTGGGRTKLSWNRYTDNQDIITMSRVR